MKRITAEQAQQLANIIGRDVATHLDGEVVYDNHGSNHLEKGVMENGKRWISYGTIILPLRIDCDLPWTEQIWRPQ